MREYKLGRLAGLTLSVMPSTWISSIILWIGLSALAFSLLQFSWATAIAAGLVGTLLHWIAETVHQLGHAAFARKIGYPMIGIRYWGWLSASVYPTNEPSLPGAIHIRRALGGPATSFLAAIAAAAVFLVLNASSASDVVRWLSFFFLIENVFVFCLGALLPLGFTDGSTLLRWWGKS